MDLEKFFDKDNAALNEVQEKIVTVLKNSSLLVLEKNRRYGNSALKPLNIFARHISPKNSPGLNSILTRLDEKLKRVENSEELRKNDISDLIGYLTLLCVDKEWLDFQDLLD